MSLSTETSTETSTERIGRIELVIGPMYAGKSTELVRIYNKYKTKYQVLTINHANDDRYGLSVVATHNKGIQSALILHELKEFHKRQDFSKMYQLADVLLIDEAQFFPDLLDFVTYAADFDHKIVIVFGLNGDFNRKRFGQVLDLIPHADRITQLKAFCHYCQEPRSAPFSKRIVDSTEQTLVGDKDKYVAVCRKHYNIKDVHNKA